MNDENFVFQEEKINNEDQQEENTDESVVTDLVPVLENSIVEADIVEDLNQYGKVHKRSRLCPVCVRPDHMDINLARARDHLSIEDIVYRFNVSEEALKIHFGNHFYISRNSRRIIELRERVPTEANEFVDRMLEGDLDFFCAMEAVLKSKAKRINVISQRLDVLTDDQEVDNLSQFETGEFIQLNKLLNDLENDAIKVQELMLKKFFPGGKQEMNNAIMAFKYSVLTSMLNSIQLTLNEFEQNSEDAPVIRRLRSALADKINRIEEEILRSSGIRSLNGENNENSE